MRQNSKLKHFRYFCYINGFLHYSKYDKLFNLKVKVNKVILKLCLALEELSLMISQLKFPTHKFVTKQISYLSYEYERAFIF